MTARANVNTGDISPSDTRRTSALHGSNGQSKDETAQKLSVAEKIARLDRLALRNAGLPVLAEDAFDREKLSAPVP